MSKTLVNSTVSRAVLSRQLTLSCFLPRLHKHHKRAPPTPQSKAASPRQL